MKITIEPTEKPVYHPYTTVSISISKDDLGFDELMELMKSATLAMGYSSDVVNEFFDEP